MRRTKKEETTSLPISKSMVWSAYKKVKRNKGSWGVDKVGFKTFDKNLSDHLYQIWNRLSSGSYFPPAVREVEIPKSSGGKRHLGIPTIGDRIAQEVIKRHLEPRLEKEFHKNSYGYRPLKSAHEAIAEVQKNVRHYEWVVDMDIKSFFDEVDHELLMKALEKHVEEKWVKMYILRWLEAPIEKADGHIETKSGKGTPQGGVISPLLANLYLHYVLDKWLEKYHPRISFVRYADDVILHCESQTEAENLLEAIKNRLLSCGLRLHEQKSKIVHCLDYRGKAIKGVPKQFDFLGFTFCPTIIPSQRGGLFLGYPCRTSTKAQQQLTASINSFQFHRRTQTELADIAKLLNPKIRGWVNYYGKFCHQGLSRVFRRLHLRLTKWLVNKYKRLRGSKRAAYQMLKRIYQKQPTLFYHWKVGFRL